MTFQDDKVDKFLEIFENSKEMIRSFEGCYHMELCRDLKSPQTMFTYSIWESENSLENYRNSDFFKDTWSKTKVLFKEQADAWSVELVDGEIRKTKKL